jgi:deazaflavin-dependent oxidoreductase (nitroreductase family)
MRRRWLWLVKNTLNRLTTKAARSGRGPFSLVRHVGRKSGQVYETPIMVARVPEGFIAELTYGDQVNWYRNIVAAGGCELLFGGKPYQVISIEPYDTEGGLKAYGYPRRAILTVLRRHEFRLLRTNPDQRTN